MSKRETLIQAILNNPKDVRFKDACKVAKWLGFTAKGGKGSHTTFSRPGELNILNFQNCGGRIPAYQGHQLIAMIEKYWDEL